MREIRPSGLEGGGAEIRSPYPYPVTDQQVRPSKSSPRLCATAEKMFCLLIRFLRGSRLPQYNENQY